MRPLMLLTARVTGDRTAVSIGVHDLDLPDGMSLVTQFDEVVIIRPPEQLVELDAWASALLRLVAADVELTRMRRTAMATGSSSPTFTPHPNGTGAPAEGFQNPLRAAGGTGAE